MVSSNASKSLTGVLTSAPWTILGAALAAYSLEVFLLPNRIIDGGVVGVSMLISKIFGAHLLYPCFLILNIPH